MSRDWQADVELIEKSISILGMRNGKTITKELYEMAKYWLQYAEKWRVPYELACRISEKHEERADKAEEREQKLRELLEIAIGGLFLHGGDPAAECLLEKFRALYPLEREGTPVIISSISGELTGGKAVLMSRAIDAAFAEDDAEDDDDII